VDQENELARAKWLLIAVLLFLVSGCISYGELDYALRGHDAEARVTKAYESRSTRGRTSLTVEYEFTEPDGTRRKGMNSVPTDWPVPPDGTVVVRYTAGADGNSRLAGRVNWIGLTLFAISVGAVIVFIVRLLREAADEPKPRRRTR
jgi:hypothetical protein